MSTTPDNNTSTFTGITDAHDDDGDYDLAAAKAGGIAAIIYKATEGGDFVDKGFAAAMTAAKAAGVLRGAYHFANNHRSGADQADHFLDTVGVGTNAQAELLVLDHESNEKSRFGTMDIARAVAFVERVQTRTGRWPVYYSYLAMIRATVKAATPAQREVLARCPLWLAAYGPDPLRTTPPNGPPTTRGGPPSVVWPRWSMMQYTNGSSGPDSREKYPRTVPGFKDPRQDRSVFLGTADELAVWWKTAGMPGYRLW